MIINYLILFIGQQCYVVGSLVYDSFHSRYLNDPHNSGVDREAQVIIRTFEGT